MKIEEIIFLIVFIILLVIATVFTNAVSYVVSGVYAGINDKTNIIGKGLALTPRFIAAYFVYFLPFLIIVGFFLLILIGQIKVNTNVSNPPSISSIILSFLIQFCIFIVIFLFFYLLFFTFLPRVYLHSKESLISIFTSQFGYYKNIDHWKIAIVAFLIMLVATIIINSISDILLQLIYIISSSVLLVGNENMALDFSFAILPLIISVAITFPIVLIISSAFNCFLNAFIMRYLKNRNL